VKKKWMVGYWNQRGNEKSLRNEHGNDKFLKIKYKLSIMSERCYKQLKRKSLLNEVKKFI
jgi:hypothetical protein